MRQYGWVIGFVLAWIISIINTTTPQVDLLFPFAVGGMMFSSYGAIIAIFWVIDGLFPGGAGLARIVVVIFIQLLLKRRPQHMQFYATAASIPYSILTGNSLSVSLAFAILIHMILQSGREKLVISTPQPIFSKEGRMLYESYRHRSRTRHAGSGSYREQPDRGRSSSDDVVEAGRLSG